MKVKKYFIYIFKDFIKLLILIFILIKGLIFLKIFFIIIIILRIFK